MCIKRRRLYELLASKPWTTREGQKSANGRHKLEIQLEDLPAEIRQGYYESLTENAEKGTLLPALADGGSCQPPSVLFASHRLSEEEIGKLNRCREILRSIPRGKNNKAKKQVAAAQLGVSIRTVERLLKAEERHGLAGIARKTRADRGKARAADEKVIARVKAQYLKPHRPAAKDVWREISKDFEMSAAPAPSYSFILRIIETIPPDLIARFRYGERYFDDKFAYYTERRKPGWPREWADGDHHAWDRPVIFRDGSIGRPWLTATRDICTLEILGFSVNADQTAGKYSNRLTIGHVIRQSILPKNDPLWPSCGVFKNFLHDLGKDFRSGYVRAACLDLGIQPRPTRGYHGKSKPIERWFGVMEQQLKHLPGYIGNKPENNPERQRIGASRTWEEMRKDLMTIDQLETELRKWIVTVYHHAESRALHGLSPMAALQRHIDDGWTPTIPSERALDLLLMDRLDRKGKCPVVQRAGIQAFGTKSTARFFKARELVELIGQEVQVRYDPDNIGEIYVYKDDRFICVAKNEELIGFGATRADLEREREIKRHQRKRLTERYDEMLKEAQYPNALERATAERRRDEFLDEERKQIAANASPKRRVYKLLPKFQLAEKAMKAPKAAVNSSAPTIDARPSWMVSLEDEELKSADELFERKPNPWLEDDND